MSRARAITPWRIELTPQMSLGVRARKLQLLSVAPPSQSPVIPASSFGGSEVEVDVQRAGVLRYLGT
jgi:hypothetical protein